MTRKLHEIKHEFVDLAPGTLESGILYVSVKYKNMVHLCCCGCGHKVVTPLSPTGWAITFDGRTVSVTPSVGNWNLRCRSHYWISSNRVESAEEWSQQQIADGFARDRQAKQDYYNAPPSSKQPNQAAPRRDSSKKSRRLAAKLREWWSRTVR